MKICVFCTGGTIAMTAQGQGVAPCPDCGPKDAPEEAGERTDEAQTMQEILNARGGLAERLSCGMPSESGVEVQIILWADKPSPHMTPRDMLRLARDVEEALSTDDVCGAVVLHGTDILAETAFVLDMVLASTKPVVVTGSMRHMAESGYDGLRNLHNGIRVCLAMPPSSEVLVEMADKLFTARDAVKSDSISIDPFMGQQRGSVGRILGNTVCLLQDIHTTRPRLPLPVRDIHPRVPIVTCWPGMGSEDVEAFLPDDTQGLVIEGFGSGNVPPGMVPAIHKALLRGLPVILATRCLCGGVVPVYSYDGGGVRLLEDGVISAGNLSATKAQLLLKMALGQGMATALLPALFK